MGRNVTLSQQYSLYFGKTGKAQVQLQTGEKEKIKITFEEASPPDPPPTTKRS